MGINKSIMIADITTRIEGRPAVRLMEIASWEPKAKQIVHVILGPGENGSGVWSKEGDEWLLKWSVVSANKHTYSGTGRIRTTGPNTSTWQVTDCMKDDQKIADIPVVHFKRRDYSGTGLLPENYLKLQAADRPMEHGGDCRRRACYWSLEYGTESPYKHCLDFRASWTDIQGVQHVRQFSAGMLPRSSWCSPSTGRPMAATRCVSLPNRPTCGPAP